MIKPQQFATLATVTVVTVLTAAIVNAYGNRWSSGRTEGQLLAPELSRQLNTAAAVEVSRGDRTLTFARAGQGWTLKERGDYPVQGEKVRALLLQLAEARMIEPKTASKDRYALLDLEDPKGKEAKSRLVRVLNSAGRPIGEVVVGKSRADAFGAGRGGVYVRIPGQPQTWLAAAEPNAPLEVKDWIETALFQTDENAISRVVLEHPGEESLVVEKGPEADAKYKIVGMAEGAKLKKGFSIEQIPQAFAAIEIEDVRKPVPLPAGQAPSVLKVTGKDGLVVTLRLRKEKDDGWVTVTATGDGAAKAAADAINAKTTGWEFKLPKWKVDQIGKRRDDIFEKS